MKKIFWILILAASIRDAMGQEKADKTIPKNIKDAFLLKYPSVEIKKWKAGKEDFTVEFFEAKKKYWAFYSPDAKWLKTETGVKWTWKLPPAVRKELNSSKYADWYVEEMKKIEMPGENVYLILVNNGSELDSDHYEAFKERYKLYIKENGELEKASKQL